MWLVLYSWLCFRCGGEGRGGLLFSVCFPFAAIFVFMLVSSLVFESISFRGFYRGPLPGVDYGSASCSLLLVSFSLRIIIIIYFLCSVCRLYVTIIIRKFRLPSLYSSALEQLQATQELHTHSPPPVSKASYHTISPMSFLHYFFISQYKKMSFPTFCQINLPFCVLHKVLVIMNTYFAKYLRSETVPTAVQHVNTIGTALT